MRVPPGKPPRQTATPTIQKKKMHRRAARVRQAMPNQRQAVHVQSSSTKGMRRVIRV